MKGSGSQSKNASGKAARGTLFVLLGVSLAAVLSTPVLAQSTWTCTSPKWDILQIMRMQTTWAEAGYYLSGTNQSNGAVYMYQAASDVTYNGSNEWTGGKLHYMKNFVEPPATPPNPYTVCTSNCGSYEPPEKVPNLTSGDNPQYWGYPADVDLFDSSYIYLWVTEVDWNNPYAFKKFNSNNNDYSYRFAPRCGVPGQVTLDNPAPIYVNGQPTNNPSTAFEILPSNVYQSGGQYNGDIISSNETFTSADCKNGFKWDDLGYSFTQVNSAKSNFSMNDTVNNQHRSLDYLPIVYWYNCDSGYANCQHREEFDYGYYPSTGDYYGLVQWLHFSGVDSQTPDLSATFDTMEKWTGAADGHYSYTNINFPAGACFN